MTVHRHSHIDIGVGRVTSRRKPEPKMHPRCEMFFLTRRLSQVPSALSFDEHGGPWRGEVDVRSTIGVDVWGWGGLRFSDP